MILQQELSPEYKRFKQIQELVDRFNKGDLDYLPTRDKEQIAMIAAQMGISNFRTKSKPVRKGLFDLADTMAFGMVPNKWRPKSVGEDYHGESGLDKFAGTTGSLLGLGAGLYGGYGFAKGFGQGFTKAYGSNKLASLNSARDTVLSSSYGKKASDIYGGVSSSLAGARDATLMNLARRLPNIPNARTGSINDEIFGPMSGYL
tara:strand:- start:46 stop:654 length:609 start_codon:yes stop_codon:yes gene_type:complete